ncbi:hypothetical protein P170DRAFT_288271 [Aspergillus steynii IBT 23096]|uniref:Uncharacterized protein n=1 Tax=Aspergillus steynii IBT 23096 TaxID=1392250 RepID=A0A2I2FVG2_9EURO|nr:uncharacterized protein P170DRAFT_288271 [Aspergillus steynii IBT 23096]PLB44556.1 hypothetical protein P170DRAFT_288271 [Aspergillus steynii IBT 23096]
MAALGISVLTSPSSESSKTTGYEGLSGYHLNAPNPPPALVSKAQPTESPLHPSADTSTDPTREISSPRPQLFPPGQSPIPVKRTISEDCTQSGPSDRTRKYHCLRKDAERQERPHRYLLEKPCLPARMLRGHPAPRQILSPQSRIPGFRLSNPSMGNGVAKRPSREKGPRRVAPPMYKLPEFTGPMRSKMAP